MGVQSKYFAGTIGRDFFQLVCGEQIGAGLGREVFELVLNPDLVVKFETGGGSFQNVHEWQVWQSVQFTDHAKWFAPCRKISSCGTVLIQSRTQPVRREELPERIPSFFSDTKIENWGLLDGQTVCHDYGTHMMLERGISKRKFKVDWWSEKD